MNRQEETEAIHDRSEGLKGADLSGASLEGAGLCRANLAETILNGANLRGSDLQGANLRKSSLYQADLAGADLGGSNLGMSDLRWACLEQANLRSANLNRANLLGARLEAACLDLVDLEGAIMPDGTRYTEETNLERFTDRGNPAFSSTLAAVKELDRGGNVAKKRELASVEYRNLPWKQFVDQTYGSLADDPIDWHESVPSENDDTRE